MFSPSLQVQMHIPDCVYVYKMYVIALRSSWYATVYNTDIDLKQMVQLPAEDCKMTETLFYKIM